MGRTAAQSKVLIVGNGEHSKDYMRYMQDIIQKAVRFDSIKEIELVSCKYLNRQSALYALSINNANAIIL